MPVAAQAAASALRRYFRFLQLQGICSADLVASIPTTPRWKLAALPKTLTEDQLHTLLSSFDRTTPLGKRDYAMVTLMASLGLRSSEVAMLKLDDLNWRDSSMRLVTPKNRRTLTLPLPSVTGRAIADYLRHGRPATSSRHVFVRHSAPRQVPINGSTIRAMVVRAYRRCGFDPKWCGTHILRHTVATQLHQHGASLKEVADLLGHRSIETSAVYAKVNMCALSKVALPWSEVTP